MPQEITLSQGGVTNPQLRLAKPRRRPLSARD